MNLAVLRRESSDLIFGFVQHWELLTWIFSPWAIGNFHVVVKAPYFQWSEITKQSNIKACIISHDWIARSLCCFVGIGRVYPILRLLKRPRHSAFVMQITCFSTSCRCFASHNQHHLIATMKHYSVHLPSSKKRNNNWIKPNKLIFLLSCHSLSQQKMKEHVPDGPSCGLGTGGFVRKIKIHFTFPSNK